MRNVAPLPPGGEYKTTSFFFIKLFITLQHDGILYQWQCYAFHVRNKVLIIVFTGYYYEVVFL